MTPVARRVAGCATRHTDRGEQMRATVDGTVIAEAPESELVRIEGNWYFPPSAVTPGALRESAAPFHGHV
jgi:uncharacterized protein (DUF427 family)